MGFTGFGYDVSKRRLNFGVSRQTSKVLEIKFCKGERFLLAASVALI
tara:strand:- start:856 stop:996 length:141 start_codon:yes stop_codon:yes gene_type:complete